ncbi:MAG TPA: FUSC family protein, partial [Chthoniobacterales bacterium]|nr:FUSC family protein [Chthoniobacterales bacterium]
AVEPAILPFGSFAWFKRELAPTRLRKIRTAIMVGGVVLCVIISMTLQVPELDLSAYMVFFVSKESKRLTVLTGILGFIGATVGIAGSILLYKFTYGYPELRIPGMAIVLFLGMWLSRVFVLGPLGFLIGFVLAYTQSIGEQVPSPELLVRGALWAWVALVYGFVLTVVLNLLFLPDTPNESSPEPKPKKLFVPDAFTNPAHVHFALKVTFAAMFCYIVYQAIAWSGIHTALITCTFIALESTGATLHKGILRMGGCIIGGALALFTIVFLMPHMVTIASLIVVVACASAVAGWVATGSEMISYSGLQIAFAFFYSVFQGYAPDTDLDNVRNRVVGILFGLIVTGVVFKYIWPEHTIDRLRDALRAALRQLVRLLEIPHPETSIETGRAEADALIATTSKSLEQAQRYTALTRFEFEESPDRDRTALDNLETTLSRAEKVFASAKSLVHGDATQTQSRTALQSEIVAELQKLN